MKPVRPAAVVRLGIRLRYHDPCEQLGLETAADEADDPSG